MKEEEQNKTTGYILRACWCQVGRTARENFYSTPVEAKTETELIVKMNATKPTGYPSFWHDLTPKQK